MADTPVKTLRIPPAEVEEAMKKGESYNMDKFTEIVRLALIKLPYSKKK